MKKTPLTRKTPLKKWRRPSRDLVTPQLVAILDVRDGRCVVPRLDPSYLAQKPCLGRRTIEHVRQQAAMGARRALSVPESCVNVCEGHIEWTLTRRAKTLERAYLADLYSVKEGEHESTDRTT